MYLFQNPSPVNNRKWNLGRLGMRAVPLPNLGDANTGQSWRRLRGLGRLGDMPAGYCAYFAADGTTIESLDANSSIAECQSNGGAWTSALNTPSSAGVQNPSPVSSQGASNGAITTVPAGQPSKDPLDYVSPQAAITAGLDPTAVYAAWTKSLARFPSPQAAIAAGVPAGVVNQLWQQSYVNAANKAASTPAIPSWLLPVGIGLGIFALAGGGRRR